MQQKNNLGRYTPVQSVRGAAAVVLITLSAVVVQVQDVPGADRSSDYVVFGRNAVTYEGFTSSVGAPVGTNGNLNHLAGVGTFTALRGGGVLNGANTNARQRVAGDVIFNGNAWITAGLGALAVAALFVRRGAIAKAL